MAAFNFPNNPSTNDLHTENNVTWKWNGTVWKRIHNSYLTASTLSISGISTFNDVVNIETDDNNAFNIIDTTGSFRPTINFKKNDSGTVSTLMQVRAEGTNGLDIKDGSGNRRVRITNAGLVGVGTDTPVTESGWGNSLHVHTAASGAHVRFSDGTSKGTNSDGSLVGHYTNDLYLINKESTGSIIFNANGSERLRITSAGNLKLTGSTESNITTQAATAGGTTTLDLDTSDNWIITMGGNTTIGDPSNEKVGQTGSIWLVQDGTGSRTAAWHSNWKWVGGTAPTLTTTASMIDRVDYVVKAAGEINAVISLDVK